MRDLTGKVMAKIKYNVTVDRTVTQTLVIEVEVDESTHPEDIKGAAEDAAANCDFNNGSCSDPVYDVVDVAPLVDRITSRPRN